MTISQFIQDFAKRVTSSGEKPRLERSGAIRFPTGQCPLQWFVSNQDPTRVPSSVSTQDVLALGIAEADACVIVKAADNTPDCNNRVRTQLLEALGL